jgi:hypothetical protein
MSEEEDADSAPTIDVNIFDRLETAIATCGSIRSKPVKTIHIDRENVKSASISMLITFHLCRFSPLHAGDVVVISLERH